MAYIYIIKNDINDKVYIGKTNFSIKKRWTEHLMSSTKKRTEKRPLYNAMCKYGKEHFWIEVIEECSVEDSSDREKYWINFYNSYINGYNATLGGDGKAYLDYKKILYYYDTTNMNVKKKKKKCNCSPDSVYNIVYQYRSDVDFNQRAKQQQKDQHGKKVKCVELNIIFDSLIEAATYMKQIGKCNATRLKSGPYQHIGDVCKGKRKTAYTYHWCFV